MPWYLANQHVPGMGGGKHWLAALDDMPRDSIASPGLPNVAAERQQFLTVQEIAGILKLNPQTVRNWIGRGTLPAHRVGRLVRIRRADFEQLLETSRVEPKVAPRPDDDGGGRSRSISSAT